MSRDMPSYSTEDYSHDLVLAKAANAALYPPPEKIGINSPPKGWDEILELRLNKNAITGLVASAFLSADGDKVIIAFRGIDNARDLATMIALGADNTYVQQLLEMPDPLNIGMGEENQRLLRKGQGKLIDGWSPQIGEALEYVKRVMDAYPGHSIEVTGYGLGGIAGAGGGAHLRSGRARVQSAGRAERGGLAGICAMAARAWYR